MSGMLFILTLVLIVILILLWNLVSGVSLNVRDIQQRLARLEHLLIGKTKEAPAQPTPVPHRDAELALSKTEAAPPQKMSYEEQIQSIPQTTAPPPVPTSTESSPSPQISTTIPSIPPIQEPHPSPPVSEPTSLGRAVAKAWSWLTIGAEFRKPGESWEYAAATHWLLRIGIITVLAGVAFFLKYSIEAGLMGPLGRVALSLSAGIVLIVVGIRQLFKKYHLIGQGLAGAGFVMLYFAFFAASSMYHLMPGFAAFTMMACVTVGAGVLAVRYQSLGIALLGVLGGYATPIMIGSSNNNAMFFYAYVLLLGAGIFGISLVRRWPFLNVLGMLAAYILAFLYCSRHHTAAQLFNDLIFLSAIHLLYLFAVVVFHLRQKLMTGAVEWTAIFLNAGIYWVWTFLLFKPVYGQAGAGMVSLAVSAVYVALVYICFKRKVADRTVTMQFILLAAVFLAMSPVLMLSSNWLTLAWCLQALAMLWLSQRTGQTFLFKAAIVLFVLASLRGLTIDLDRCYNTLRPWQLAGAEFWKSAVLRLIIVGSLPATLTAAWRLARDHRHAAKVLGLVLFQVWLYVSLETDLIASVYAPDFCEGAVTLVWTLFAFALLFTGIRRRDQWLRWAGLALFALAVLKLLLFDLSGLDTSYRIIAFISTGILLVLGSSVYLKYRQFFEVEVDAKTSSDEGKA